MSNSTDRPQTPRECEYCAYGLCAIHLNTLGDADYCYPNPEYCPDFTPKIDEQEEQSKRQKALPDGENVQVLCQKGEEMYQRATNME